MDAESDSSVPLGSTVTVDDGASIVAPFVGASPRGAGEAAAAVARTPHDVPRVADSRILVCGPPAMNESTCELLEGLRYPPSVVVVLE